MVSIKDRIRSIDSWVSASTFGRVFMLEGSGHQNERRGARFFTEIGAGFTTFFTMAYIISVNASILTQSGGTCFCTDTQDPVCLNNPEYRECLIGIKRDLTTATAAIAGIGSLAFGFLTNLPWLSRECSITPANISQLTSTGPGMGLNAYFTFQVVGFHGTGSLTYRQALTAVFIEGFIFVFLSLIGMRQWLVKIIPNSIKVASGVGIGMFLTEIGMSNSGIGMITSGTSTPTDLGGCAPQYLDSSGRCSSHKMTNPTMWIGIVFGGVLTAYLMSYRVKSAIIIGICVASIISWPRDTPFTYFPYTEDGDETHNFFKQIVAFHPIRDTLVAQDWNVGSAGSHFALALFSFLYVDIIDCTATLFSMARFSGVVDPETGEFPRSTLAYCCDAVTISISSLFGCSPVTVFIESGAGIAEGGRTGLTAIVTGLCFLVSIFFAPIFASIPPWATGCTLILVGCMMMRQVTSVNWAFIGDALPAFVTIVSMPFTYSVAYGIITGLFTYTLLNGLIYITRIVSRGHIEPPDFDSAEYWTYRPTGAFPPWFIRATQGKLWCLGRVDDVDEMTVEPVITRQSGGSEKELIAGAGVSVQTKEVV